MPDECAPSLTPREVAELAGVSLRVVEKAIEEKVLTVQTGTLPAARDGKVVKSRRLIGLEGVAYLAIMRGLAADVTLSISAKRKLAGKLRDLVGKDLTKARVEIAPATVLDVALLAVEALQRAVAYVDERQKWIVSDPGLQGGLPVIRGTRITAHSLEARVAQGETIKSVAEDYAMLPREAITVAILFAKCHPLAGRPSSLTRQSAA